MSACLEISIISVSSMAPLCSARESLNRGCIVCGASKQGTLDRQTSWTINPVFIHSRSGFFDGIDLEHGT